VSALVVVDLQNDFMHNGALEVKGAEEILPLIHDLLQKPFDFIVATQDWHPHGHVSFASTHHMPVGAIVDLEGVSQTLWPDHCIQGSWGAALHSGWDQGKVQALIRKGEAKNRDSYSAFFDNCHQWATELESLLRKHHIRKVYFAGLAMDYCVKYSVLDACQLGFDAYLIKDACRAVNERPQDSLEAIEEMKKAGAHII
jgi:nicotinamidase/pyrazinamidase